MSNKSLFAMYVIGFTESGNRWDSINYNDPITCGMMQWFGTRAAALLNLLQPQWGSLTDSIRQSLESHPASDGWWASRYLTRDEGYSIQQILKTDEGKAAQQATWGNDYNDNVSQLAEYGFSEANAKPLILLMSALHQSPRRGLNIARSYGGNSDLDRIYAAIKAEPVLSKYMTYRYTPTYEKLKAWDGESAPPDFGQTTTPGPPPGDPGADPSLPGGPAADDPNAAARINMVQQYGDHLMMYTADGRKMLAFSSAGQTWRAGGAVQPVPNPDDSNVPPPTTTPPPTGGAWVHPVPGARKSSGFGPRWGTNHRGLDLAAPLGTPMYAVADGVVLRAGTANGFGGYICIKLDNEQYAVGYGHMNKNSHVVQTGQHVTKGQQISAVGNEGQSTGPHCHFEVYENGQMFAGHIDPEPVLINHGVQL